MPIEAADADPSRSRTQRPSHRMTQRLGRLALALAVIAVSAACSVVGGLRPQAPSTAGAPSDLPSVSNAPSPPAPGGPGGAIAIIPSQLAIRLDGRTEVWNGDRGAYEVAAPFRRDGWLFLSTKPIGGGTAVAILSGELFEERAGAVLFATNTSALRDIPAISRNLVNASLDVASMTVDDRAGGRFEAKVDPVLARTVTALYFQIRDGAGYPAKQVLGGTLTLSIGSGSVVSGTMTLEGADFVGGARPLNRYVVTISSA